MSDTPLLSGVVAPMFTPVHGDLRVDLRALGRYIDFVISRGAVDALFLRAGVGKWMTWTMDEIRAVLKVAQERAAGRIPFVFGAMGIPQDGKAELETYTRQSIELAALAAQHGARAAVLVTPFVTPAEGSPDETTWRYLKEVHDATDLPLVVYKTPGETTFDVDPALLQRLLGLKRLAGMKYSSPDAGRFGALARTAREKRPGFALLSGNEELYLEHLRAGAAGIVSEGCSTYPELFRFLSDFHRRGRDDLAAQVQERIIEILNRYRAAYTDAARGVAILFGQGLHLETVSRDGTEVPDPVEQAQMVGMINAAIDFSRRLGDD